MKKYLIFLMMAAAIAMFGACSPEDENEPEMPGIETPETPDEEEPGDQEEPDNPDNPDDPNNPGRIPILPKATAKFWLPISVGEERHNVWRRRLPARPEPTFFG